MLRRQSRTSGALPTSGIGGGHDDSNSSGFGAGYGGGSDGSYGGYGTGGSYGGGSSGYGGGGGMGSPSPYGGYSSGSHNSDLFKEKSRKSHYGSSPVMRILSKSVKEPWIWPVITTIIFAYLTIRYRSMFRSILSIMDVKNGGGIKEAQLAWDTVVRTRDSRQRQITTLQEQQRKSIQKQNECEQEKKKILKERDELRVKYENPSRKVEELRNSTREKAWRDQVQLLQAATQRESRRSASEK